MAGPHRGRSGAGTQEPRRGASNLSVSYCVTLNPQCLLLCGTHRQENPPGPPHDCPFYDSRGNGGSERFTRAQDSEGHSGHSKPT